MSNRLVQWYRGENPDDARGDDEITLDLAGQFPDEFQTYPDALKDFERIRTDLLRKMATPGDYIKQGAGELIRGAADMVATLPESAAVAAARPAAAMEEVLPIGGVERAQDPRESSVYKSGEAIRALGRKLSPDPVEGLEGEFWPSVVPRGLGQAAGFMAGGAAGKLLKVPGAVGIAGLGAASSYAPAWKEAKAAGASDEQAYDAAFWNGIVGTSEAIPLSRMLKRLDGVAGKKFTKMLWTAGKETFEESVQEAAQTYADNYIAREIYDKDRDLLKDLVPSAAAGGVTGFLFSAITQAIGAKLRKTSSAGADDNRKPTQTTTGSNAQMGAEMPVQQGAGVATDLDVRQNFVTDEDRAAAQEVIRLMKAGQTETPQYDAASANLGQRILAAPALQDYFAKESEKALPRQLPKDEEVEAKTKAVLAEVDEAMADVRSRLVAEQIAKNLESRTEPTPAPVQVAPASTPTAAAAVEAPQPTRVAETTPAPESGVVPTAVGDTLFERAVARRLAENPSWTEEQARRYEQGFLDARKAAVNVEPEDVAETASQPVLPAKEQYADTPRIRALKQKADAITASLPPVRDGFTRLWRGNKPDEVGKNPSFTSSLVGIALPFQESYNGPLTYVDVATSDLSKYVSTAGAAPGFEFMLPAELAKTAAVVPPMAATPVAPVTPTVREDASDVVADVEESINSGRAQVVQQATKAATVKAGKKQRAGEVMVGVGQKASTFLVENPTEDELYTDAERTSTESTKQAVLQSPDGSTVVRGTAYTNVSSGKRARYVSMPQLDGSAKGKRINELLAEGWKLIGALKVAPRKGFTATYSPTAWDAALVEIRNRVNAIKASAAAVETKIKQGRDFGRENEGEEDVAADASEESEVPEASAVDVVIEFSPQEAGVLLAAVGNVNNASDVVDALAASPDAIKIVGEAIRDMISKGVDARAAAAKIQDYIYENYSAKQQGAEAGQGRDESLDQPATQAPEAGRADTGGGSASATGEGGSSATQAGADASGEGQSQEVASKNWKEIDVSGLSPSEALAKIKQEFGARTRHSSRRPADQRNDLARFNALLSTLGNLGVNVKLVTERLNGLVNEFGRYDQYKGDRGQVFHHITLSLADTSRPTVGDYLRLLEEGFHIVFANESPAVQAMANRAMAKLAGELVQVSESYAVPEAGQGYGPLELKSAPLQEERLAAVTVRHLSEAGFNSLESGGIAQAIVRWLRDLYHRVVMAVMEASGLGASPERVQAYFENRVKAILSGDAQMSVIDFLGGPKLTQLERIERDDPIGYADMIVGPSSRTRFSASHLRMVDNPHEPVSPDQNGTELKKPQVAAQNFVQGVLVKLYDIFNDAGLNTMALTFDQFARNAAFVKLPQHIGAVEHYAPGKIPTDTVAEINKGLEAIGQQQIPGDFKLEDVNEPMRKRTAAVAHRVLKTLDASLAEQRRINARDVDRDFEQLQSDNREWQDVLKDYTDLNLMQTVTGRRVNEIVKAFKASVKAIGTASHRAGVLEQVLVGLDRQIDRKNVTQWVKALETAASRISGGEVKFGDAIEAMSRLGLDWETVKVAEIKAIIFASSDKALAPLLEEKNLPLLATLIAFSKSNANVMDMLSLRREAAVEERKTANEALQLALGAHETAVDEARALLKKHNLVKENGDLTRIGRKVLRILSRLQELKKRRRALLDKIENGKRFNEWYDASRPMLRSKLTELEKMIGAQYQDWQLIDGAEIPIPPKPGSSMEATLANTYTVNLKDTEGLLGALRKLRAWLDSVPEDQRGADWTDLDGIYKKASTANIFGAHRAVRQNWFMRLAAPIQDRLRFIGTATSKLLAARMYNMEQGIRRYVEPMNIVGHDWEVSEHALIKATGTTQLQFRDRFFQPILGWLEKNQDKLAEQKTDAAAENAAVRGVIEYLSLEDGTRDLMAKPGVKAKFERFLRQTAKVQRKLLATGAELGNKVLDATGEYKVYRDPIGAQLWTSLRATNETGHGVWEMMQGSPWATAKLNGDDAVDLYLSNPETYTTPEVILRFMRPWVNRQGRSAFYAPAGEDGIRRFATRENVIKAAEASGGNLVTFAEALYELEDGTTDPEVYKTEVLHQWQANFDLLEMIYQEPTTGVGSLMPQISQSGRRFLADSRKGEELPGEWLEYLSYDTFTLQQVMKAQVFQSVFGRHFEAWTNNLDSAKKEQALLASAWQQAIDLYGKRGLTGRALIKAAREEVRGGFKNLPSVVDDFAKKASLTALEQAARNLQSLNQTEQDFKNLMRLNQSRPMEFRAWQSLLGAMSGLVVSGPATALTDNIATVEQPFRKLGFSWETVKFVAGIKKQELFLALNSLLQATHMNLQADSAHVRMLNDLGRIDDDATISVKEKFAALVMQEHNLSTGIASKVAQTVGQLIRMFLTTGIGRAREGTAVYPTLKLHSPFVMWGQISHLATVMKFWQQFESFVGAAVKHLETHAADLHNPDFKFTREQIRKAGFPTSERAWQYYNARLAENGVGTLEATAVDSVRRRALETGAPLLTKDAYVKLAVLAQNDILLDSGLATRAPWLKTTVPGSVVNPLLGWALHKAYDAVALGVRTPTGEGGVRDTLSGVASKLRGRELTEEQQQAVSGTRTAMIAMLFGVLPATLAYALMRDWYDEYVMKRKGNVRPLTSINSPGDAMLTLLDNSARVGTFGVIGELANSNINFDSARPVTLDSRIFLVSTAVAFQKSLQNWIMQGSADWATVGRPMMQAMGGSGFLQYADSLNGMLGADNQESRVARRVGVNNYLRAAGRELDMDVRRTMGSISMPSKTKMYIGRMVASALANDAAAFNEAHRNAKRAAKEDDKEDPEGSVKRSFAAYHPLRIVFQTVPSESEYRKLLTAMSDQGRASVAEALRLFNYYGEKIGVNPSLGRKPAGNSGINLGLPKLPRPLTLQDFRRAAVNFGNE